MKNKYLKQLFLIDGLGAILSAFLLGIVLVNLESYFGIPKPTLYFLASFPILFAVYDLICYFKIDKDLVVFLKIIAIINIIYCCLSIVLAFYHFDKITRLGWVYIIGEIVIVLTIAVIELKAVNNYNQN